MSDIRASIIDEAMRWINTPFHHEARVINAGVDCANLLVAVFSAVGLMPNIELDPYPQDWHLHRDKKRFIDVLSIYAYPITAAEVLPGDVAMWKYGRQEAHGSIVVAWPTIIHAWRDAGAVVKTETERSPLAGRLSGFWRMKGLED